MTGAANEPAEPTHGPTNEELRAVPVETLRAWYVDECELSSVRRVAATAGIGRTTLWKFIAEEAEPQPRTRRLLGLYYMRARGSVDEQRAADAHTALTILAGYFPEEHRPAFVRDVLGTLERGFTDAGVEPPTWLERLRRAL